MEFTVLIQLTAQYQNTHLVSYFKEVPISEESARKSCKKNKIKKSLAKALDQSSESQDDAICHKRKTTENQFHVPISCNISTKTVGFDDIIIFREIGFSSTFLRHMILYELDCIYPFPRGNGQVRSRKTSASFFIQSVLYILE